MRVDLRYEEARLMVEALVVLRGQLELVVRFAEGQGRSTSAAHDDLRGVDELLARLAKRAAGDVVREEAEARFWARLRELRAEEPRAKLGERVDEKQREGDRPEAEHQHEQRDERRDDKRSDAVS